MKKQYKVRREIIGEFVAVDVFDSKDEATECVNKAYEWGRWDRIDMWEI